jgi:hypothetical protein
MIKGVFIGFLLRKTLLVVSIPLLSLLISVGLDFSTYQALTGQQKVFTVEIMEAGDGLYDLTLIADEQQRKFRLAGDQWQIDFRLIRFSSVVSLAGISNLYQPSRLSNRYINISDQKSKPINVYSLRDFQVIDGWRFLRGYDSLMPFIDSVYGSSVFMPLKDGAEYEILIGYSGLVVKSLNDSAKTAVLNWQ